MIVDLTIIKDFREILVEPALKRFWILFMENKLVTGAVSMMKCLF